MDNTIKNPLIITCVGDTFKLNKMLIVEDEQSFEFVDKKLAVELEKQSVAGFMSYLIDIAIEKANKKTSQTWYVIDFDKLVYKVNGSIMVYFERVDSDESDPNDFCEVEIFKSQYENLYQKIVK